MPFQKLQFRPGINRETTSYTNEGGWFHCDKIRFRFGLPEKIGGWDKYSPRSFLGSCRGLHSFVALDGSRYVSLGTHLKYYINEGGAFQDITPIRLTTSAGAVTFSATNGSSTVRVTHTAHGAKENDFVTFSGATSLGGNLTAAILNQEYQIIRIENDNSYDIEAREVATVYDITINGTYTPTLVTATGSDSGNGGSSVVGTYQVTTGLDTSITGTGWGAGTWGRSTWSSSASIRTPGASLRIWSHDNFGEDLIINARDEGIFYWDRSLSTSSFQRAASISSLSSDSTAPTLAKQVMISDRDRHVILFGCDSQTAVGTMDPLLIRFSDQENPLVWESLPNNTAGDLRIGTGSQIVAAIETRQQILVFTDVSLHAMQYLGPPFTFGINTLSANITVAGPLAIAAVDDTVFWMGEGDFYIYTGQVQKLPCSVRSYVFNDLNTEQREKITCGVNSSYSEIWWFYVSANSLNVDKYVIYNYQEKVWYYGNLNRSTWMDRGINPYPIAAGTDGFLYQHEIGWDDRSSPTPVPINSFVESSQMSLGSGDNFVFLSKIIPDVTFDGSESGAPSANFTLQTRNWPGENYGSVEENTVTRSATVPVEQFTNYHNVRLRGRSFAFKIESDELGVGWRLGTPRVDIRPDGRK